VTLGAPGPGPASRERRSSSSVKGRGASGAGPATDRRGDCCLGLVIRATFSVPEDGQEGRTAFGLRVDIPTPPAGRCAAEIPRLPGPPRRHGTRGRDGAGHAAARPDLPVRGSESGRTTINRGVCSKRWDGASQIASARRRVDNSFLATRARRAYLLRTCQRRNGGADGTRGGAWPGGASDPPDETSDPAGDAWAGSSRANRDP